MQQQEAKQIAEEASSYISQDNINQGDREGSPS
jgi:hypothetical protein